MATSDPPSQSVDAVGSPHHHHHHHHHWFHHHHHRLCPYHHHHHCFHHRHHPLCTVRPYCFGIQSFNPPNCHSHMCPRFASLHIPPKPESITKFSLPKNTQNLVGSESKEADVAEETQLVEEGFEEVEDDEGEEVFVMTDEWVEFFAKSEARRKLEKKLAKKKKRKGSD